MTLSVYIKRQTYIIINILYDCLIYILWCIDNTCVHILSYFIVIVLFLHNHILIKIISYTFDKIIIILWSMYHSLWDVLYSILRIILWWCKHRCNLIMISQCHLINHDEMIGNQLYRYSASCYRVYYYITQFSSEVTPPVMY